jgi:hypothetical protein
LELEMNPAFTNVEPDLLPILDQLRRREPIFHSPQFGSTTVDFERSTAPDYWEVGASGRRSRARPCASTHSHSMMRKNGV